MATQLRWETVQKILIRMTDTLPNVTAMHDSDNNVDDRRQEEFYKLLAKHNMLPPPGWVKSKLKGREHANSVTLV